MYKIINETTFNILLFSNLFICAIISIPLCFFGIPFGIYNVITSNKGNYKNMFYGILLSCSVALPMYYFIVFTTLYEFVGYRLHKLLFIE